MSTMWEDNKKKEENSKNQVLSFRDFIDPTNPWDLRDRLPDADKVRKMFNFVPEQFKEGRWNLISTLFILLIVCLVFYLLIDANINYYEKNDIMIKELFMGDDNYLYPAFTTAWYYNSLLFSWMVFLNWSMFTKHRGGPFITFTMCSWTIMCIRHGLCAMAPFLPSLRLFIGILRFPVLLSSSVTFGVWNFLLMPVIALVFLKKGEQRNGFLKWALLDWALCQIHIFNILYAYLNCVWAEPARRSLHLGDINAAVIYIMTYVLFYYSILDRVGIHLYPIFSPRTYISIPSWIMAAGVCIGTYQFWNKILIP